jgi:hypothetical protein
MNGGSAPCRQQYQSHSIQLFRASSWPNQHRARSAEDLGTQRGHGHHGRGAPTRALEDTPQNRERHQRPQLRWAERIPPNFASGLGGFGDDFSSHGAAATLQVPMGTKAAALVKVRKQRQGRGSTELAGAAPSRRVLRAGSCAPRLLPTGELIARAKRHRKLLDGYPAPCQDVASISRFASLCGPEGASMGRSLSPVHLPEPAEHACTIPACSGGSAGRLERARPASVGRQLGEPAHEESPPRPLALRMPLTRLPSCNPCPCSRSPLAPSRRPRYNMHHRHLPLATTTLRSALPAPRSPLSLQPRRPGGRARSSRQRSEQQRRAQRLRLANRPITTPRRESGQRQSPRLSTASRQKRSSSCSALTRAIRMRRTTISRRPPQNTQRLEEQWRGPMRHPPWQRQQRQQSLPTSSRSRNNGRCLRGWAARPAVASSSHLHAWTAWAHPAPRRSPWALCHHSI